MILKVGGFEVDIRARRDIKNVECHVTRDVDRDTKAFLNYVCSWAYNAAESFADSGDPALGKYALEFAKDIFNELYSLGYYEEVSKT